MNLCSDTLTAGWLDGHMAVVDKAFLNPSYVRYADYNPVPGAKIEMVGAHGHEQVQVTLPDGRRFLSSDFQGFSFQEQHTGKIGS